MLAIVLVQALSPHASVVHNQASQEIHRTMSFVFEFLSLNLTRSHRLGGHRPLQNLDVEFLVSADDHFAALP